MNPLDALADIPPWEWPPEASELVVAALRSRDPSVRLEAATSAWHAMSDKVAEVLLHTLRDPDPEVAGAAATALGPTLDEHDGDDLAADPTYGYARTSRAMFEHIAVELELTFADPSVPDEVRRRVCEAAVCAPAPWIRQAVRDKLADPDPDWRTTAVFCCGSLPGFEVHILSALGDSDPGVRFEAVRASGERALVEAAPVLAAIAGDEQEDRDLRLVAIGALGSIPSDSSVELLEALLLHDDDELAETAEEALQERALARSLAGFTGLLPDDDWN